MKRAGLAPGLRDGYVQAVPLVETQTLTARAPRFAVKDGAVDFAYGKDVTLNTRRATTRIDLHGSGVVFVGYGVNAPEHGWNDYAGIDVRGKTVLVLINDPDWRSTTTQGEFGGAAMTYYGRWTYKFEEAARQGAAAAIIVHETKPAAYGWQVVGNSYGAADMWQETGDQNKSRVSIESWITLDTAKDLFRRAGLDYPALKAAANKRGFKAVPMEGEHLNVTAHSSIVHMKSRNVMGMIPGTRRPDDVVIFSAHWDHLGRKDGL